MALSIVGLRLIIVIRILSKLSAVALACKAQIFNALASAGDDLEDGTFSFAKRASTELFSAVRTAQLMTTWTQYAVHWLITTKIALKESKFRSQGTESETHEQKHAGSRTAKS